MKTFSALLVDDEPPGLRTLAAKIEWSKLPLKIIAEVDSVARAIKVVENEAPDFIFLDVKMPNQDGFALFQYIDLVISDVIFTTAHEEFALKAFQEKAAGYLLKPISQQEFNSLMGTLIAKKGGLSDNSQKISFKSNRELIQMNQNEIVCLLSEGVKSRLITTHEKEIMVSMHLKSLESSLSANFYRIHHQVIINLNHVERVHKGKYANVVMLNGRKLEISRSKKMDFYLKYAQFLSSH